MTQPVSAGNLQLCIGTVYAGTMTAGSAALVAGAPAFTAADVGRRITVIGAGPNTGDPYTGSLLVSHIASYTDSTHVTLADAATTAVGGGNSNTTVYRPVGASVAAAINYNSSLTARDSLDFTYLSESGVVMIAGSPVWLSDIVANTDIFGGTIDQAKINCIPGSDVVTSECQCVSWDYLLSKRLATPYRGTYTSMTLAAIALDLINYQAGSEGITVSSVTGPTLTIEPFDFSTVYEALDKLCTAANDATHTYIWYIDAWKVVHIIEQTAVAAPWNIDDRDGSDANALDREGEGITVTWSREKLANRVYTKASRTLSPDLLSDAQQGNGSTRDFTTKANIEQLTSLDVDGVGKTWGIAGVDSGKDFYYTPGSNAFNQDAGASPVASGHWIHLSYYTSSATVAFAQNNAGVDAAAQVEGGTGFWDTSTSIDTLMTTDTATALAQSQADTYGMIPVAVDVLTYRSGLKVGQIITIHLSDSQVSGNFLIDSVSLDATENLQLWTIHAVNGALIGDWRTALIALAGGSTVTAGGMLPPPAPVVAPAPTVFLNTDATLGALSQTAMIDASGANRTETLPAMVNWIGLDITIVKNDVSANTVTWQCQSGETVNGSGSGVLTDPGQSITLRAVDSTHAIIVSSGVALTSPPPSTYPDAPNVTSATATVSFPPDGNGTDFSISGVISLPYTDANYPHLKAIHVIAIGPDAGMAEIELTTVRAPFSGTTANYQQDQALPQDYPTDHTYRIEFRCENEDGKITAGAYGSGGGDATHSVAVHGARVTSITSPGEVGTRYVIDENNDRLPMMAAGFTPVFAGSQTPINVTSLISSDSGAHWTHIGPVKITSVGQQVKIFRPAPEVNETWMVASAAGFLASAPTGTDGKIADADLATYYPGIVRSATFSVAAIATPAASNGITATVGAFAYKQDGPEGQTYGYFPPFTYTDPSGTNTDFFVRVTVTDIDGSHNPVGPEKPYTGTQITGPGDSHTDGGPLLITLGAQAGERFKIYVANKTSTGAGDFADPTSNTLQNVAWNGGSPASQYDVMFGTLPAGALNLIRVNPTTLGSGLAQDASGKPILNTSDLSNMVLNPGAENGMTGWTVGAGAITSDYGPSTGQTVSGLYRFKCVASGLWILDEAMPHLVKPGEQYYMEVWESTTAAGTRYMSAQYLAADGVTQVALDVLVTDTTPNAAWHQLSGLSTVPSGASYIRVHLAGSMTGTDYVDAITLRRQVSTGPGTGPDGNGGVRVAVGGIDTTLLANAAVHAANMAAAAITAANAALDASSVVDGNIVTVGINKVTYGTSIFAGDVVLSRGISKPVVVLANAGLTLFSQADASTGASGLTSHPYVSITSSGLGLFSGGNPSVTVDSSTVTLWSVNGNTSNPYVALSSASVSLVNGSNSVAISSGGITITQASGGTFTANSTGFSISKGSSSVVITSTSVAITNGTLALTSGTVTINIDGTNLIKVANSASSSTCKVTGDNFRVDGASGRFSTMTPAIIAQHDSSNNECDVTATGISFSVSGGAFQQVIGPRLTGPGNPVFVTVSDAQSWCQSILNQLRNHGLLT